MDPATTVNEPEASRDEALYREGSAHLQGGEFAEAIRCFEALSPEAAATREVRRALDEARFKARLEGKTSVRPKQWLFPWRLVLVRVGIVIILVVIAGVAINLLSRQAAPMWARAQAERQAADLQKRGDAFLEASKFDQAEAAYRDLLKMRPGDAAAEAALVRAAAARELVALYDQGIALQQTGDLAAAQQKFTEVTLRKSDYKDVTARIAEIRRQSDLEAVWQRAEAAQTAGRCTEAIAGYQQVKALNASYKKDVIAQRLFDCYLRMGQEIVQRDPPAPELVDRALEYYTRSLALQPRNAEAAAAQQSAATYLAGRAAFDANQWPEVVTALSVLHTQQPGYLKGAYLPQLYESYIHLGDEYRAVEDFALAWDQYNKAAQLPVADKVVARARMMIVEQQLTPTPTPTATPLPTGIPTPTPMAMPTVKAPPTPASPLATYRNQILFWSDKEDEPGLWVMNPDGTNRRYLGNRSGLRKEYDELIKKEALSPDGRYRVYNTTDKGRGDKNPQIYIQGQLNEWGNAPTWLVTTGLTDVSYDPVWSPDGSRIAFVSNQKSSDDIWLAKTDGTDVHNCTSNDWEWDKHPTWSPDSSRIIFWSNRDGLKQIYSIDAACRNVRRLTHTAWDEYDPIWVK